MCSVGNRGFKLSAGKRVCPSGDAARIEVCIVSPLSKTVLADVAVT